MRRRYGWILLLALAACQKDGDAGYTALMRYQVTDFRVAGIDARPADPQALLPLPLNSEILLSAVLLAADDNTPVELEWLDCPSYAYGGPDAISGTTDCLGTPREIRLGRGPQIRYRYQIPDLVDPSQDLDAGFDFDIKAPPPDPGEIKPIAFDDGTIYLRATRGDQIRYGRKTFAGLFALSEPLPTLLQLQVNGASYEANQVSIKTRPGDRVEVQLDLAYLPENRAVQWFVTTGTLTGRGLTYFNELVERQVDGQSQSVLVARNTWAVGSALGKQRLVAVVGGDFGPLPHAVVDVEVRP